MPGDPAPSDLTLTTASDLEAAAVAARADIERLIQLGALEHDPLRHPIQALGVHLEAFAGLAGNIVQTLEQVLAAQKPPITAEDVKALNRAAGENASRMLAGAVDRLVLQRYRTQILAVAGMLIITLAVGFGAGWYVFHMPGDISCADQPNGGQFCGTWVRPPAVKP